MALLKRFAKRWALECPKCQHREEEKDSKLRCHNCDSPLRMSWMECRAFTEWETADDRRSWRKLECSKQCGVSYNNLHCSKCNAIIAGDYIKEEGCFITEAACNLRGLGDDCFELTMARQFREEILRRLGSDKMILIESDYRFFSARVLSETDSQVILASCFETKLHPAALEVQCQNFGQAAKFYLSALGAFSPKESEVCAARSRIQSLILDAFIHTTRSN